MNMPVWNLKELHIPNLPATAKIALVIGNRDYMNLTEEDQPLVHTCNDAKQLASMLHKPQMGFKVISLINLTKAEMEQAVDIFCSLLGPGVYGLVYFAGHGFEQDGQNYLVPIDAEGGNWTPEEAVCVQAILKKMVGTNVELNIFLLDVCRKRSGFHWMELLLEVYDCMIIIMCMIMSIW